MANPKKYFRKSKYREEVLRRELGVLIGTGNGCDEIGYDDDPEEQKKIDDLYYSMVADADKMSAYKKAVKIIHGLDT